MGSDMLNNCLNCPKNDINKNILQKFGPQGGKFALRMFLDYIKLRIENNN